MTKDISPLCDKAMDLVLLVMLPTNEEQMMVVQINSVKTIRELEDYIVVEHQRVFPNTPALNINGKIRLQKCISRETLVNRYENQMKTNTNTIQTHCFVEISKTVNVGNVFSNMEQVYVVKDTNQMKFNTTTNEKKSKSMKNKEMTKIQDSPTNKGSKTNVKIGKNQKVEPIVETREDTTQENTKKNTKGTKVNAKRTRANTIDLVESSDIGDKVEDQVKTSKNSTGTSLPQEKKAKTSAVSSSPSRPKRKTKESEKVDENHATEKSSDPIVTDPSVSIPKKSTKKESAKKSVVIMPANHEPNDLSMDKSPPTNIKAAPKKRKKGESITTNVETEVDPKKAKKVKVKVGEENTTKPITEKTESTSKHKKTFKDILAETKDRLRKDKEKALAESANDRVETLTNATEDTKIDKAEVPKKKQSKAKANKAEKIAQSTNELHSPADDKQVDINKPKAKKETDKNNNLTKAKKSKTSDATNKVAEKSADSVSANSTTSISNDDIENNNNHATEVKSRTSSKKKSFAETLAATRKRIEMDKNKLLNEGTENNHKEVVTNISDDNQNNVNQSKGIERQGNTDTAEIDEQHSTSDESAEEIRLPMSDSSSGSSDFEDLLPKTASQKGNKSVNPTKAVNKKSPSQPTKKSVTKAASPESDSSDDDSSLVYSQAILADLTKNDDVDNEIVVVANSQSPVKARRTKKAGTSAVHNSPNETKKKQKLSKISKPSSQEGSQNQHPEHEAQESRSLLLSNMNKKRFSLGEIPVAKLKKSKNPFA